MPALTPILNIADRAATEAGKIIMRALPRLKDLQFEMKENDDFVTEIDLAAESAIVNILTEAYPQYNILSEECGLIDRQSDCTWIVDPLDGTTNFLRGIQHFAVSIALEKKGKIEHGLIFQPATQDVFMASRGQGASLNGRRLKLTPRKDLRNAVVCCAARYTPLHYLEKLKDAGVHIRFMGASTIDLANVAAGAVDVYFTPTIKPWDHSAAGLMIKEAGGFLSDMQGGVEDPETGGILACNRSLAKQVLSLIDKTP